MINEMKALGRIAYWVLALALVAAILVSLDYSLVQAIFMSLVFGPCALALEFLMPKARRCSDKNGPAGMPGRIVSKR